MVEETKVDDVFIRMMSVYREAPTGKGLLEACSNNVVLFSEKMLGITLYAWQVDFLMKIQQFIEAPPEQRRRLKSEFVAITSRQIGKSTAISIFCIWACTFNKYPGTIYNNTSAIITSASDVQAKKLLTEMNKIIVRGDKHMGATYKDKYDKPAYGEKFFTDLLDSKEPNNTTTITFKAWKEPVHGKYILYGSKSGCQIKSYPPTPTILGETATIVIIDEAGMTDRIDDTFFYDYIYPVGNSTNAVRIYTSTPWISSGFFYRMVDPDNIYGESPAEVCMYTIDSIKIENPNYYETVKKIVDKQNADGETDAVQRAYYCRFVKGERAYFIPQKVQDLFTNDYEQFSEYKDSCDMGIDFGGQVTSRTVITISAMNDRNQIKRIYHKAYEVGKDLSLIDDVADLLKKFNIQRIIPDDCPAGYHLIRVMKEEKGWNVQPMNFRADKVKKYGAFRTSMNKGKIQSYKDDLLKTEMMAMEYSDGARQSVLMHAPGYTDDLIDSFVMSTYFMVEEENTFKTFDYFEDSE